MDDKTSIQRITEFSGEMLSRERIIIYGLMTLEFGLMATLFYLVTRDNMDVKLVEKTMDYFFNTGFIILGALVNSVQHNKEKQL